MSLAISSLLARKAAESSANRAMRYLACSGHTLSWAATIFCKCGEDTKLSSENISLRGPWGKYRPALKSRSCKRFLRRLRAILVQDDGYGIRNGTKGSKLRLPLVPTQCAKPMSLEKTCRRSILGGWEER